jgi:Cu(I)/Ag(I) efflux system membrane fusion protein
MAKKSLIYLLLFSLGLLSGLLLFSNNSPSEPAASAEQETVWTCSMHPQIRQHKFGQCPLCAMDLIPANTGGSSDEEHDDDNFVMSKSAAALANIQTTTAKFGSPQKTIRLYGSIEVNEKKIHSQTAHANGRIEKLFVNFAGEKVARGQVIATIYSPDLLAAQQEFLEAAKRNNPLLLDAAKNRLSLSWKLTESQITELEQSGKVNPYVNMTADESGVVFAKRAERGNYINESTPLFDIVDLSSVWVVFSAYEADLPHIKQGDQISYSVQALPGQIFTGRVAFIDPIVDPLSRTAKVRLEASNPERKLKPGMVASAMLHGTPSKGEYITLPKSAVLWTGERSVVYVQDQNAKEPTFRIREITLGSSVGDSVLVISGIFAGERVVSRGVFALDASAQMAGKKSMTNLKPGDSMNKVIAIAAAACIATATGACKEEEHAAGHGSKTEAAKEAAESHATMQVQGSCEMCKARIEAKARSIDGVKSAIWDLQAKQLHLQYDSQKLDLDVLSSELAAIGHDTEKHKATDMVYNSLPGCCKYR